MKMLYTFLVVGIGIALLMTADNFTGQFALQLHPNSFINGMAKYQLFGIAIAILVTGIIIFLNPESRQFLNMGQLDVIAEKEVWLGINGRSSWKTNGLQLLLVVSIATGVVMFLDARHSIANFQWSFLPLIFLFSLTNSLTEELIFRFGVIGGLFHHYPKLTILIISAILFGVPHYFGWPSGFIGILMSGLLGYILCKATMETKGLLIAWSIHFVQDVIIFAALFMINAKQDAPDI